MGQFLIKLIWLAGTCFFLMYFLLKIDGHYDFPAMFTGVHVETRNLLGSPGCRKYTGARSVAISDCDGHHIQDSVVE